MSTMNRRSFLKGAALGALGLTTLGVSAIAEEKGIYTPGTYSATATGMGEVKVTMTFDANAITNVVVDTNQETTGFGLEKAGEFAEKIMAAQSAEIDAVSGVTLTSDAVKKAAQACIDQAKGAAVEIAPVVETVAEDDGDWLGAEPEIPQIDETVDVDIVVVGAGLSGLCAARAAAEEGAKVVLIEKGASYNVRSGEYALLNGSLNERWGRTNIVDTDVVVNRLMRECTYRNKRSIIKKWAEHAHEAMDWFIGAYPDLTICDSTRQVVTQEQFDKGILVPLAWPQPEHTLEKLWRTH